MLFKGGDREGDGAVTKNFGSALYENNRNQTRASPVISYGVDALAYTCPNPTSVTSSERHLPTMTRPLVSWCNISTRWSQKSCVVTAPDALPKRIFAR